MAIDSGDIQPLPELKKIDYSSLDFDTIAEDIINYIKIKYPNEQNDFLESNTGKMIIDVLSYIGDLLSYRADFLANENFLPTVKNKKALLKLLRLIDYELGKPAASQGEVQATLEFADPAALDINGGLIKDVILSTSKSPLLLETVDDSGEPLPFELYLSQEDLDSSVILPAGTQINESISAVVIQGKKQIDYFETDSNASPNQTYQLSAPEVLKGSIIVTVNGAEYTEVDSLVNEPGATRSFEVIYDEKNYVTIKFGDGIFGAIPPASGDLTIAYRTGGGARGNLIKNALNLTKPFNVDGKQIIVRFNNVTQLSGGRDEQTIESAKKLAPQQYKAQVREVTGTDYSVFASGYSDGTNGSISKAIALLRPYLVSYGSQVGPFTITPSTQEISLKAIGNTYNITLNNGIGLTNEDIIQDFNNKVESIFAPDKPLFEMIYYPKKNYQIVGTIPEPENGYDITGTQESISVNYNSTIYTVNLTNNTGVSLDTIISELNTGINVGANTGLALFQFRKIVNTQGNFLVLYSTREFTPGVDVMKFEPVANDAYSLFGVGTSSTPVSYTDYGLAIAMIEHHPNYTLEILDTPNNAYNVLGLQYSTGGNGLGRAFPCSANYIDVSVLALGPNNSLVPASEPLKDALEDYMNRFKQLTDQITIWDGQVKVIDLDITVKVSRGFRRSEVQEATNNFFNELFNPDNLNFGEPLYISKIYEGIEAINGVNHVDINDLKENGVSQLTTGSNQIRNVDVKKYEIITRGIINVIYEIVSA